MKYSLLLLLVMVSFTTVAQKKMDTKIIVTATDTANLFNRIALYLYEQGYTIEQKDKDLGFMATGGKTIPTFHIGDMKLKVLVQGDKATFTGEFSTNMDILVKEQTKSYTAITYRGMRGSLFMDTWNMMDKIAKNFGMVAYSK